MHKNLIDLEFLYPKEIDIEVFAKILLLNPSQMMW